jgi:tetratricopeptide (TPR) repeat protein
VDPAFGRVSYTQYESLYARQRGKKVWYLFIDETFPIDPHEPESDEVRELQATYRRRVQVDAHLFHALTSRDALEAGVLKLRDDLTRLRRGAKLWAAGVGILLLISVGIGFWLLRGQHQTAGEMHQVVTELQKLRQGILAYPEVESRVRQTQMTKDPVALQERVYSELSKQLGVDVKLLKENAPRLFENWKSAPDATSFERATAAYVAKDYAQAERIALQAVEEAKKSAPRKTSDLVRAFKLAGIAAQRNTQYDRAMEHFREAEKLTDPEKEPEEWATVQEQIAAVLSRQGRFAGEENVLRKVVELRTRKFGPQQRETLQSRVTLAAAKSSQAKYAAAETEFRELTKLDETLLGPEDPNTLWCRESLAQTLMSQGKYSEAESEFREIVKLNDKVLGPEHSATLTARNNLAIAVLHRGNSAEAKMEFEALMQLNEKLAGPEHPDTLLARYNLAITLIDLQAYQEAEGHLREVVRLRTKVLGPEHRDTLKARRVIALAWERLHHDKEADAEFREVVALCEKVLAADDPERIDSYGSLASSLFRRNQFAESKLYAQRAVEGARKVLGAHHPQTKHYEDLLYAAETLLKVHGR